jgi:hypothetical protein
MPERLNYSEGASRIADRRKHSRVHIKSLSYIKLEEGNGGLIFNISEGGLAVQAAEMLIGTVYAKMRFRLPRSPQWIEMSGKLVWEGASRKEAGIQFVDVGDDVRQRIQNWVKAVASCPDTPADTGHSRIVWEKEEPSFLAAEPEKVTVPAEFDSMFPSEKSLASAPSPALPSGSTFFPSEADGPIARRNRPPLASSGRLSFDPAAGTLETDVPDPSNCPPNQSDLQSYRFLKWARAVVGVDQAQQNDAAHQSLNSGQPLSPVCNASVLAPPSKRPPSVQFVDPITGRSFYEELIATHAAATNSHSLHPSWVGAQLPLREAAPPVSDPAPRPIAFSGFGYQPSGFEAPSGKGWLAVAVVLFGLLAFGAVVAIGPANVKSLLFRHSGSPMAHPPPPENASEKTGPSAPASSRQSDNSARQPVPLPDTHVQTSQTAPNATITKTDRESFPPYAQDSDKKDVALPDSADAEAETRRFQREHSQTGNVGANASQPAPSDANAFPRQQVVPPIKVPVPPPISEGQNDQTLDASANVNPPGSHSSGDVPSPLVPQSAPQTPAMPSGTIAIRSHFHSIWGSQSPPSPSDGVLLIGQLASMRQPAYPVEAERTHVEGTIELRVIVDQVGAVEIVQLVSGPPILAPAAINAVREWRYRPTILNGRAVQSVEDISVVFRLGNSVSSPR